MSSEFINSDTAYSSPDIPERLIDKTTTYKHHNVYTHLFCVLIRISLGLYLISSPTVSPLIYWLLLAIIVMFGMKFGKSNTWKCYLRTVIAYSTAFVLLSNEHKEYAGLVIIMDALLGVQSRFNATLLK